MSIFEYSESALVAMVGKNCFAMASDRFPANLQDPRKAFHRSLRTRHRRSDSVPEAGVLAQAVSASRREEYEARNLCQIGFCHSLREKSVIAGFGDDNKPFICTMDSIGAKELAKDFVVAGTASESLFGACEAMFKPGMEAEELFETISQALLSSVDCDCLSGWGGHVYVVQDLMNYFLPSHEFRH